MPSMSGQRSLIYRRIAHSIIPFILIFAALPDLAFGQSVQIAAIVNDEPVSAWDVEQRVKFYKATGANGSAEALKTRSLKELVDELLMHQEAKRIGVSIEDDEVRVAIEAQLKSLKRSYTQFKQYLLSQGIRIATLENRLRARLAWNAVIRRTYGNLVSITESDIEEAAEEIESASKETDPAEILVLQRIVLAVPEGADDTIFAQRMLEAEKIRTAFRDCARIKSTLKQFHDVTATDIPKATADDLAEPTRSLVLQASAGQMTPPNTTSKGIEMVAVCDRRANGGRLQLAQRQLVNQELGMLSDRHLRDLRQDAVIDYR